MNILETQTKVYDSGGYRETNVVEALVEHENYTFLISVRDRSRPTLKPGSRYITQREMNEYHRPPRLYFHGDMKESIFEDLLNRFDRPWKLYRKELLPPIIEALDELGIKVSKCSWSQKAGCSCGCSPGFIVAAEDRKDNYRPYNIFVTYSC